MTTVHTFDAADFEALDPDELAALDRYLTDQLGPELKRATITVRYTAPGPESMSVLEVLTEAAPAGQTVGVGVGEPPTLAAWTVQS
jgi:hypothetical protein